MPPEGPIATPRQGAAIADVLGTREAGLWQRLLSSQAFWVTLAILATVTALSAIYPDAYRTSENLYNVTRNLSFIGIMALGVTAVIITGGIDISVGSIMGAVAILVGLVMQAGYSAPIGIGCGLLLGTGFGLVNGLLVGVVGLPSFVVTLGMLQVARSVANVLSGNQTIYDFGPGADDLAALGGDFLGLTYSMWLLIGMAIAFGVVLHTTVWGRHLFAVGGNEHAARLTGVPVTRVKIQAYALSGLCAAIATIMVLGWTVSASNGLGQGYELRTIASTVIGGANLMGGEGGAYGAVAGAALIEVIRNGLNMSGVDSNWQGIFVGAFIILAVLLQQVRGRRRA